MSMKPETVLLFRKLAREATIFALLAMVVAAIGAFVFMDYEDRANAKRQAVIAVHAGIDFSKVLVPQGVPPGVTLEPVKPAPTVQVPLTNGAVLQVRRCEPEGPWTKYEVSTPDCRKFTTDPIAIRDSVPLGNPDQIAIEKDYWTTYGTARHLGEQVYTSLFVGLLGFPAGLVLWIFYRLVRFAVKG